MAASHVHAPDPKDVESALRALRELTVQQAPTSTAIHQANRNGPAELADDTDPAPSIVPPEPAIDQNEEIGVRRPSHRQTIARVASVWNNCWRRCYRCCRWFGMANLQR